MKTKLGLLLGVALFSLGQLSAVEIDIGSMPGDDVGVEIDPITDTFTFRANGDGHSFFINIVNGGAEDSVGLRGHVTGTFQIGSISPWVDDPGYEYAPVTSSPGAQLIIFDGSTPFVADVAWLDIVSDENSQFLNIVEAAINLKNIVYAGSKQDLRALAGGGEAYAIVSFTTHKTLTQLTSGTEPTITSFNGDLWAETYGALGDYVWEDVNRDGIQDSDELGIPGVTVNLYLGSSTVPFRTTITGANGEYLFDFLAENTYRVEVVPPAGFISTLSQQGSDDSKDSNPNPYTVSLGLAESNLTIDFGFYRPASLGDYVWEDLNANGQQDTGEPRIANVTVHLVDCAGNILATTTTDANGIYSFTDLVPGSYAVQFVTPGGYVPTLANVNNNNTDSIDSDSVGGMTQCVTLESGDNNDTLDAGFYRLAEIGDLVWHDVNGNGIQDLGEPGIGGVTVNLLDHNGDPIATTVTSLSGYYMFQNLVPGTYAVEFIKPAGYNATGRDAGADDAKDSDADTGTGRTGQYVLASGDSNLTVDAGFVAIPPPPCIPKWTLTKSALTPNVQLGGLASYKYVVVNTGDCDIVGMKLVDDAATPNDPSDDFDVTTGILLSVAPAQTFDLAKGEPREFIRSNISLLWEMCGPVNNGGDSAGWLYTEAVGLNQYKVTFVQSLNRNDNTYGAGSVAYGWKANRPHRFSDLVNSDQVTFSVKDGTGKEVLRFQQDYISKISTGVYRSLGPEGGDGKMIVGSATSIVAYGSSLEENLAKAPFAGDPDYLIDSGDPAQGWDIYMRYWFVVNIPSFGGVAVIDQHNSPPKSGAESFQPTPCAPCLANKATSTVPGAAPVYAYAQVCVGTPPPQKASLGDRVWIDTNKNGVQDAGELGFGGVTVNLQNCSGVVLATTTTGPLGEYHFTELNAGSYRVQFVLPSGYAFSPADQGGNDANDSDANTSSGLSPCVTLAAGEQNYTVDAGIYSKTTTPPPSGVGTGTPGYWMNHPNAWPVTSIVIGGTTYTRDLAIKHMKSPAKGDVTYNMFAHLVSAKLNVLIGNDSSCISTTITAADAWLSSYKLGTGVKASSSAWKTGEPLHEKLDDYNNGLLCAPSRG
jgi:hypothetical protein